VDFAGESVILMVLRRPGLGSEPDPWLSRPSFEAPTVTDHSRVDPAAWARAHFADAELGDRRRTKRLVCLAAKVASDSMASLPDQAESWADLKAAYRLFDADDVTFDAVATPHWARTRAGVAGRWLILDDTTELDFGGRRHIEGVGPVGSGSGQGFLLHSALMAHPDSGAVRGLAGQILFRRTPAPRGETRAQRRRRGRESEVWGRLIERVGAPAAGAQFVHVMDRGADDFEVFCRARRTGVDWVARLKSLHRRVRDAAGVERPLSAVLDATTPVLGYTLKLRARPGQPARTARLEVRYARVEFQVPRQPAASLQRLQPEPIAGWVVQVREVGRRPPGAEPIEWTLFTSLPVEAPEAALEVLGYYEQRWLIEEWHKALKTGCRVEARQLQTGARLAPLVGLLSVVAVRLLELRAVARGEPDRPTEELVPRRYVRLLEGSRKVGAGAFGRVGEFVRGVAKLGGFLGRKGDGEPGWMTIWRGWEKLQGMVRGADLYAEVALE
jgi:Transposase DNA-binding/Transposase Tn5 dimerisation domain